MKRIDKTFQQLKKQGRAALIPFIMAGDGGLDTTARLLPALAGAGADLIEIGMPFSDPVADGPTIQQAGLRALAHDIALDDILETVAAFRRTNDETPVILMGYYNPVYRYGGEAFCQAARQAGVDGLILVDLPPEEEDEFLPHVQANSLSLIKLVTPTSDSNRLKTILKSASGFVYYVAVAGITGDKSAQYEEVGKALTAVRAETDLPLAVGFGIKTPEDVKTVGSFADAAVVGSALIAAMQDSADPVETAVKFVESLALSLR